MHFHLSSAGGTAHGDVFQCSSETRQFMTFEMRQGYEYVRVMNRSAYLCGFYILPVNGNFYIVGAFQAVPYYDLTACGHSVESVVIGGIQVFRGGFSVTRVQSVAIRQKRHSAVVSDFLGNYSGVARSEISQISQLAEVHLDCDEFFIKINISKARSKNQSAEFIGYRVTDFSTHIRKENFRFHDIVITLTVYIGCLTRRP
jgi:hypothetical protein